MTELTIEVGIGSSLSFFEQIPNTDILGISSIVGFDSAFDPARVAAIGTLTITLKNDTRKYTPGNTLSPFYQYLKPNVEVYVRLFYGGSNWYLFWGTVLSWEPEPGQYEGLKCTLTCQDKLGKLEQTKISLPLIENQSADYALKQIGSFVFRTGAAQAQLTFSGQPSNNETVQVGDITYTFKSTLSPAPYEVLIGSASTDTAQNLTDCINAAQTSSTTYGTGTVKNEQAYASRSADVVTLNAVARGAWGNSISLVDGATNVAITQAWVGGVDGPSGKISYDAGILTFVLQGHTWREGQTNALTAITDCVESEFGLYWCSRNGTLVFKNKDWFFTRYAQTPDLTSDDDHNVQDGRTSIDDIYTRSTVTINPTKETAGVVVAQSNAPIQIPAAAFSNLRYGAWADKTIQTDGSKVVTLPFINSDSADTISAKDLTLPLEPGTDYQVYIPRDGSGTDLSSYGFVTLAVAPFGSGVDVSFGNQGGEYWVYNLQVRGTRIEQFNPARITYDSTSKSNDYGRREIPYNLPFASTDTENFGASLAQHLLTRNQNDRFVVTRIGFDQVLEVDGVSVYSLEIGDVIKISETQTAVSNFTFVILGIETLLTQAQKKVTFIVRRIDDVEYWILEDADSQLGVNTVLGV